jgi:hypothetical protein
MRTASIDVLVKLNLRLGLERACAAAVQVVVVDPVGVVDVVTATVSRMDQLYPFGVSVAGVTSPGMTSAILPAAAMFLSVVSV